MGYRLSRRAERDLKDIYRYTYLTHGEQQADKYLRELDAVFEAIGDHPNIGRPYSGRVHQFVHGKHIVLYRMDEDVPLIGRILHGAARR